MLEDGTDIVRFEEATNPRRALSCDVPDLDPSRRKDGYSVRVGRIIWLAHQVDLFPHLAHGQLEAARGAALVQMVRSDDCKR